MTGAANASSASGREQKTVFHVVKLRSPLRLLMICSIRFLRSEPVTPDDARQRRLDVELARLEDALRVDLRLAALPDDLFVAGALALVDEPRADPPHQRMKPEHRLHDHVQRRGEIVATANVRELVREDRFDLLVAQTLADAARPQQDRPQDAEDARLERGARRHERKGQRPRSRRRRISSSRPLVDSRGACERARRRAASAPPTP